MSDYKLLMTERMFRMAWPNMKKSIATLTMMVTLSGDSAMNSVQHTQQIQLSYHNKDGHKDIAEIRLSWIAID